MAEPRKIADNKYRLRASVGTGRNRVWSSATFEGTLREARDETRSMERILGSGKLGPVKFETCFEIWKAAVTPRLKPRTVEGYDHSITKYALPRLKSIRLGKIERTDIQAIYDDFAHFPTTVRNLHSALNAMFSWFVRRGDLRTHPCQHTDRPAKPTRQMVIMDEAEAAKFSQICVEMPLGAMFAFALETGMRPEEYLALRWSDIRGLDVMVTRVVQYKKGGGYYFEDCKTKGSRRRVPISEAMRLQLVRHRREQNEHRLKMKGTWFNEDLIFPNEVGRPLRQTSVIRWYFKPLLDKCSFDKHLTLYSLRHTMATLLLMAGVNPKIVSERLGHSSIVLTLDTYSHVLPHIQDEATAAMERMMRRG